MTGFLLRRLGASILLLFLVLSLTFFILRLAPGDPTSNRMEIPQAARERLREAYGLDRPLVEQYGAWLHRVLFEGDWGVSYVAQRPVAQVVGEALPHTLLLGLSGLLVNAVLGFLLGVAAARRQSRPTDHAIRVGSLLLYSLPVFWLALMASLLLSYLWPVFPASNMHSVGAASLPPAERLWDLLRHLALPALVLGVSAAGGTARFVRNGLLEVMEQDYIRTARAKGLSEGRVVWLHALSNSLVPMIQLFGLTLPTVLNGALVVEVVFSWPGLGQVIFNALEARDYPVVLATTAFSGLLVIVGNLLADLLHGAADPRVRHA